MREAARDTTTAAVTASEDSATSPSSEGIMSSQYISSSTGRVGGLVFLDGDGLDTGAGAGPGDLQRVLPNPYRTTLLRLAVRSDWVIRQIYGSQCGPVCPRLDGAGVDQWRRPLQVTGAEHALWSMQGIPGRSRDHHPPLIGEHMTAGPAAATPRKARKIWLMFIVATVFGAVLVSPYLLLDINNSRLDVNGEAHYALLVAHIFTALIALVLGPLQFIPVIRRRRQIHRTIGRVYLLAGVLPSALTAVPVALLSGRLITQIGLTIPAILWLITGTLAYQAARRHDYTHHQNWMMRNYALTFLAVTSRILVPLLLLAQVPFTTTSVGSIGDNAPSMIPIGQALGWIVNLIAAETLIRRRQSRSARSRRDTRPSTPPPGPGALDQETKGAGA
jgi:uncharacterized membrane protein